MVTTIAELPFREALPDDLLGIDWARPDALDEDHTGFGWGHVPRLTLAASLTRDEVLLEDPLVLALHSADRPAEADRGAPFDLELVVAGERLHLPLERFLAVWLPRLPPSTDIVLAVCNPTGYPIPRPPGLPAMTRLWVPTGDVDSSAIHTDTTTWVLTARTWSAR